jgi:uncharacterized SAM-binding protein YcdF (DUF218 family)
METVATPSADAPATLADRARPASEVIARAWGWTLLVLALAVAVAAAAAPRLPIGAAALAGLTTMRQALVSVDRPPARVDAVAVHGGGIGRERERTALALLRQGAAGTIVALGGPLPPHDPDRTYAGAVRRRLAELDAPPERVVALPEGLSTRAELVALRRLAERRGWRSLALSTSSWHTLRVRLTAAEVFAGSTISWSVVAGPDEDGPAWWASPHRRWIVLGEWLKIAQLVAWPSAGRL